MSGTVIFVYNADEKMAYAIKMLFQRKTLFYRNGRIISDLKSNVFSEKMNESNIIQGILGIFELICHIC